ncbi:aldehyde ferredoxin oxidoreductase N-terminal domain-containing protein [Desulfocurvibacter africanus]|uniref:aldehyde ferredoxin oxidoreductase N-terminal domain-containing protein n=1 Tax=Desulfocurvibacter africanus TaxID=873 RepID=UPI00042449D8|nr:aldehyde ferredoxin oxidoreductase C-terminal domain-containing protein [Desulfocurvibacter africanus]
MPANKTYRVVIMHLDKGYAEPVSFGDTKELLGGSHLAAALYDKYGLPNEHWDHPDQPLIFAIGPLVGYFPLMSKVVCAFKSPYNDQYSESHAGGRLALAMRFANADAILFRGRAKTLSAAVIGARRLGLVDVHYLKGMDVFSTGRSLRKTIEGFSGHRSLMRIGPAGENLSAYACINVDTYRHFGRMGSGTVMGVKNLKAVMVQGDESIPLPEGKPYQTLFRDIYKQMTATHMMSKYFDLGTPQNLIPLNELKSLPWRNLQATHDSGVEGISGERFAKDLLLRNTACSGCPVGCIHIGMLREMFSDEHRFKYHQVAYDYEPIFSVGSMIGVTDASGVLSIMDEVEKVGVDVMSAGVALAWATEAFQKGIITEEQTLTPLEFGYVEGYKKAVAHLGYAPNEFYMRLANGALKAAAHYGGEDFACVLGQEMAGYATGEVFFAQQAMSFRHSHLDAGGYSYDQTHNEQDADKAIDYLIKDEQGRCVLTSMVACLFSRGVYKNDVLSKCLDSIGYPELAGKLDTIGADIQKLRWQIRFKTGYDPVQTKIPKRFLEIETWKGKIDPQYLDTLKHRYGQALMEIGRS